MTESQDLNTLRSRLVADLSHGIYSGAGSTIGRREQAGEQLGQYERAFRLEVAREIQRRIAEVALPNAELLYNGQVDPGMAAWVDGLRDADAVVREYIEADV